MTSETEHFLLTKLDPTEGIHAGDGRFASADRDVIDQALWSSLQHRHTGDTTSLTGPTSMVTLSQSATGGTIPAGVEVRYCYTIVNSTTGESTPSPVRTIITPAALLNPVAPTASTTSLGGTLGSGGYYYVLSHYKGANTVETQATNPVYVDIPTGATNQVTLTMPGLPAGATGFNIYRRNPNQTRYYYLASTTSGTYTDDGTVALSTTRGLPASNTTNSGNSITITAPGDLPGNQQWRIYRSYNANFTNSFLTQMSTNVTTFLDTGLSTGSASPPRSAIVSQPSKIDLINEVEGTLSIANGGTDATTPAGARSALGLVIGTNVQAYNAALTGTTGTFTSADRTKLDATPSIHRVVKVADETRTNSTNSLTDSALFFTSVANSTYIIEGMLIYSSSTTADILFAWTVPSGATLEWHVIGEPDTTPTIGLLDGAGVGTKRYRSFRATCVVVATAGTVAIRWAQNVAEATNTTVFARSHLMATRVQ